LAQLFPGPSKPKQPALPSPFSRAAQWAGPAKAAGSPHPCLSLSLRLTTRARACLAAIPGPRHNGFVHLLLVTEPDTARWRPPSPRCLLGLNHTSVLSLK
jgi:hypothetical protein